MDKEREQRKNTLDRIREHVRAYPKLEIEDIFKFIHQSACGCEHLVSDRNTAAERIIQEYSTIQVKEKPRIDALDGKYSRVHLSCLNDGLSAQTLAGLFCLSAKKENDAQKLIDQKLISVRELIADGTIKADAELFEKKALEWRAAGYPAVHHSNTFRNEYCPAYRVIANEYLPFLKLFSALDSLTENGRVILAVEGGSASGKSTLADVFEKLYDCNVIHMDDFFLRPEQRSAQRYAEIGGNIDRERFLCEVIEPLKRGSPVKYSRFDCSEQRLGEPIELTDKKLTVIEGVYSMHPAFDKYYDFAVFLYIDAEHQKKRILKRNSPEFAKRFFDEWIPMENRYFAHCGIKEKSDIVITASYMD